MAKANHRDGVQDRGEPKSAPKLPPGPEPVDDDDGDICSPRAETSTDDDMPLA